MIPFCNVCKARIPFFDILHFVSYIQRRRFARLNGVCLEMCGFLFPHMFLRRGSDSSFSSPLRRSGGGSFRKTRRSMMETSEVPEDGGPSATPVGRPEKPQMEPINGTQDDN